MKITKIILAAIIILITSNLKAQDLNTQAPPLKVKEYGIGLSSFNSFSIQYRWGNEKRLFRINATVGGSTGFGKGSANENQGDTANSSSNTNTTKSTSPINFNTSLSFSILKIKYVAGKFALMYGGVAGVSYSTTNTQTTETGTQTNYYNGGSIPSNTSYPYTQVKKNNTQNIQPYIGVILGASYKISEAFLVYLEIAPNIYYSHTNTTSTLTETDKHPNAYITNTTNKSANNTFGIANLSNSGAMLTFVYRITK